MKSLILRLKEYSSNGLNKQYLKLFVFLILCPLLSFADCDDHCPLGLGKEDIRWTGKARVKALKNFDLLLYWAFGQELKPFPAMHPLEETVITSDLSEVNAFQKEYGYFSETRPIVSKVTTDNTDLELVCCLFKALYKKKPSSDFLDIAVAEILTKALAYRDLKLGQKIKIPLIKNGNVSYEPFHVDYVFDIWLGMPAFGLVPEKKGIASILLFRGTEFSLISKRGWASLMSDLDIAGPGLTSFHRARAEIHTWLQKVSNLGKSARAMGFSLGGALATYTFIYENALLSEEQSVSFCAPGVADKVVEEWSLLPKESKRSFITYINSGDIVSKVGQLLGTAYALSTPAECMPITAHTMLISSQPSFSKVRVDVVPAHPIPK